MTEITNERGLQEFLRQKHAVLFFHAPWCQYAVISKQMIELVESYAKMGHRDVSFFFGEFEGERLALAEALVAAGVPATIAFTGGGSLSFFRHGKHERTMKSVIRRTPRTCFRVFGGYITYDPSAMARPLVHRGFSNGQTGQSSLLTPSLLTTAIFPGKQMRHSRQLDDAALRYRRSCGGQRSAGASRVRGRAVKGRGSVGHHKLGCCLIVRPGALR